MDGRLRIHLNCELEHGLRNGTISGTTCTKTHPTRLVAFLGGTSPMGGPFHSTLSHNRSHNNNYMACKRKHIMTLVVYRHCCWQHWKFQWFISIPFFESQFLWSYMITRCVLCNFDFYNFTNVHTFVTSSILYPLGIWAICKGLLHTPP
jgi:hypothetical protein